MTTTNDIDAIRKQADAATEGPWGYDSYSGVFSAPKVAPYDQWLDTIDDGHSLERHGKCGVCGTGCRLFGDDYRRDPLVAHVPAHHGDTAIGTHAADAEFIAAARTLVPALCDEIEQLRAELAEDGRRRDLAAKKIDGLLAYLTDSLTLDTSEVRNLALDLTTVRDELTEVAR